MKRAVIYYSLTDNTRKAAELIAEKTKAQLIRIDTVKPMPKEQSRQFMIGGMQACFGMCPKINPIEEDLNGFDEIILGSPVWASKCVPAVNSLLNNKSIREKITYVFTLSGGGDNDKCIGSLKKKLPNMKKNLALADIKNVPMAEKNAEKINSFAEEIIRG